MVSETGLKIRMAIVGSLLFGLYLLVAQILMAVGLSTGWVLVGLAVFVGAQYKLGRWFAIRSVDAHDATPDAYPELHRTVNELCRAMDLKKPRLLIANMGRPNAFAVGRRDAGVVVISRSLLDILDWEEVVGVLAHELAHLDNRDVVVMVLGQSIATIVGFLTFITTRVLGQRSLTASIIGLVFGSIAQFLVTLLVLALSRYREYAADETAANHTGRPEALASALDKIETLGQSEVTQPVNQSVDTLSISSDGTSILSTHPPVKKRIARLEPEYETDITLEELQAQFEPVAVCPNCNTAINSNLSECQTCGEPLESDGQSTHTARGAQEQAGIQHDQSETSTGMADTPSGTTTEQANRGTSGADAQSVTDTTQTRDVRNEPETQASDSQMSTARQPQESRSAETANCPSCGNAVQPTWQYCESCGTQL